MGNETHPARTPPAGGVRKLAAILSADVAGYSELGREAEAQAEAAAILFEGHLRYKGTCAEALGKPVPFRL